MHLKRHRATPNEFEDLMTSEPAYLEYRKRENEERYKVLGVTKAGRVPIGIWTPREGKVRAVTAYAANRAYRQLYWENHG
ncbi:MAG: BrnT family toxin [Bryobacteraceae bacterium]